MKKTHQKNVTIMITIQKDYRDLLRIIAAEETLKNPDKVLTGSHLAKEFLCKYLDEYVQRNKVEPGEDART